VFIHWKTNVEESAEIAGFFRSGYRPLTQVFLALITTAVSDDAKQNSNCGNSGRLHCHYGVLV
jgi:hypothetical protein